MATRVPKCWLTRLKSSKFSGNAQLKKHNYNGTIWAAIDKAVSAFFLLNSNPISITYIRDLKEEGVQLSETSGIGEFGAESEGLPTTAGSVSYKPCDFWPCILPLCVQKNH